MYTALTKTPASCPTINSLEVHLPCTSILSLPLNFPQLGDHRFTCQTIMKAPASPYSRIISEPGSRYSFLQYPPHRFFAQPTTPSFALYNPRLTPIFQHSCIPTISSRSWLPTSIRKLLSFQYVTPTSFAKTQRTRELQTHVPPSSRHSKPC